MQYPATKYPETPINSLSYLSGPALSEIQRILYWFYGGFSEF